LVVSDVRSIAEARLSFAPGINLVTGRNGSGKTSLLESLYLLSSGKSFRTGYNRALTRHGVDRCAVFGRLQTEAVQDGGRLVGASMGVSRSREGERQYKYDGVAVRGSSTLAQALPITVVNSDSFALVDGSPADRRQFLDWGVFHVEHEFLANWQRAQRALKQRNFLLRRGKISTQDLDGWERELAESANRVDRSRKKFVDVLNQAFSRVYTEMVPASDTVMLRYRRGWDEKRDYRELLATSRPRDADRGFTQSGPHRAELAITVAEGVAADVLSRGQLKMLVVCLKLAQTAVVKKLAGKSCVLLVDDLPAELDPDNRDRVLNYLVQAGAQAFITAVDAEQGLPALARHRGLGVFHVEQGVILPR
jgi:DNA replication and repair protein RecF